MPVKKYYKLVRDKIPAQIIANGGKPKTRTLSDSEMYPYLFNKLVEEAEEARRAYNGFEKQSHENIVGELADVQDVFEELLTRLQITRVELHRRQSEKRRKNGGFKEKIFLETVKE